MKNVDKQCTLLFNLKDAAESMFQAGLIFGMIAHDKGKPVVKQGRKAVSLEVQFEIVRLPKAIEENLVVRTVNGAVMSW